MAGAIDNQVGLHALWGLASASFMSARTLQTAVRLGVFAALAGGPRDVKALARACRADEQGMEALLVACVALGLLERSTTGLFRNSWLAARWLVPGEAGYYGEAVDGLSAVYEHWVQLEEAVRSGRAVARPSYRRGGESLRAYLLNVHRSSEEQARRLVEVADLGESRKLLDVGGGLATYSIALCRRWPQLKAVVLELAKVVPFAREMIASEGLANRITAQAGDYRLQGFGEGNDVVLIANVLQHEPLETRRSLLAKAFRSLAPGGLVLVHDSMLNPEKTGPLPAALGGLNLLLHSGGGSYSSAELTSWLREAGFVEARVEWQSEAGLALAVAAVPG